jgi:hypothetical protein
MDNLPLVIGAGLTNNQIKFINAYTTSYCNVSKACIKANIARNTFYRWQLDSDSFAEAVEQAKEGLRDRWEDEIARHVFEDRNPIVLNKFAPSVLKDRGYADIKDINLTGKLDNTNEVIVTIIDGGDVEDYE